MGSNLDKYTEALDAELRKAVEKYWSILFSKIISEDCNLTEASVLILMCICPASAKPSWEQVLQCCCAYFSRWRGIRKCNLSLTSQKQKERKAVVSLQADFTNCICWNVRTFCSHQACLECFPLLFFGEQTNDAVHGNSFDSAVDILETIAKMVSSGVRTRANSLEFWM